MYACDVKLKHKWLTLTLCMHCHVIFFIAKPILTETGVKDKKILKYHAYCETVLSFCLKAQKSFRIPFVL